MFRVLIAALIGFASSANAEGFVTYSSSESFEDVTFAVESAILSKGLVIDSISHTAEMLERTKADVGSNRTLFLGADVYQFCSATISRQVMEVDQQNFLYCPYSIHVFEMPETAGTVTISHAAYEGSMAPVQELLESIVKEALDID
jgi:uncharacterized protein (DUF302 family)